MTHLSTVHPSPVGPFAEAAFAGPYIWTSGMAGCDMNTGEPVSDDAGEQARKALENLDEVLQQGGSSLDQVIKATLFIRHREDFETIDATYKEAMKGHNCARACVFTSAMVDNRFKLEIEVVALRTE